MNGTLFHHEDPLQDCGDRGMFRSFSTFVLFRGERCGRAAAERSCERKTFSVFQSYRGYSSGERSETNQRRATKTTETNPQRAEVEQQRRWECQRKDSVGKSSSATLLTTTSFIKAECINGLCVPICIQAEYNIKCNIMQFFLVLKLIYRHPFNSLLCT